MAASCATIAARSTVANPVNFEEILAFATRSPFNQILSLALVALTVAIVYTEIARLFRGYKALRPAELTHYRLSRDGLSELRRRYHVLGMPVEAWSDPAFMGLLLDNRLPYARLALLRQNGAPEFLLLPRQHAAADALGEGLRLAGAPDVVATLAEQEAATQLPA